uniref:histidine kinase n=1 Tax=Candidatus Kentrum sp. DK TaxID=2126562 RepID=A0A450RUP0_9GAMM|nr:MAG: Signal transduction histidine kinase [Candidatus Kentron sp. DK]
MAPHSETAPQTASELAHTITGKPVVIWLQRPRTGKMTVEAQTGFESGGIAAVTADLLAEIGNLDVIAQMMASGQEKTVPDIRRDPVFRERDLSQLPNPLALLAFPVSSRGGEAIGAIGIFGAISDQLASLDRQTLAQLTDIIAAQTAHTHQARYLADAARQLIQSPNLNDASRIIAEAARKLTGAYSSVVWLWNDKTEQFTLASHAAGMPWAVKPRKNGLTRYILERKRHVKINDALRDNRIQSGLVKQGIRSQIGIPIWRGEGQGAVPLGVLFVSSDKVGHFTRTDEYLLVALVGQFFAGFGWGQRLMEPMDEVEEAIARLFGLNDALDSLCKKIQKELGFDYVAIQLIRPLERTLETIWGTGRVQWIGARHAMDADNDLLDIQVAVARSRPRRRIEVLHGWDKRLDRWIYERFGHKNYVRLWAPMLLVRDESGQIDEDWWKSAHWQEGFNVSLPDGGWHFTLELQGIKATPPGSYSLGTVDAGFCDPERRITPDQARQLANMVSEGALDVRKALLPSVLETIADCARRILHADAASLHFAYNSERREGEGQFTYEVTAGKNRLRFYHHNHPEYRILWEHTEQKGQRWFIPDESQDETDRMVESLTPSLYGQGIRALAAFPFVVEEHKSVLYVYFETPHRFTGEELRWVESFVRRAERAVRDATRTLRIRSQSQQLANLHEIARSLVTEPDSPTLLRDIAGHVTSILGADVVTIYEYSASEKRFGIPSAVVGRLIDELRIMIASPSENSVQFRAIKKPKPVYAERIREKSVFRQNHPEDFIEREKIQSAIACPLTVRGDPVGVMFINYRTRRTFADDDKNILVPTLTASAAMAIQVARSYRRIKRYAERQHRELEALSRIEQATASDSIGLRQALDVILQEAMTITSASVGFIVRYDRWQDRLDMVAWHGLPTKQTEGITYTPGTGIVGQCAKTREPQFAPDVRHANWKDIYYEIKSDTRAEIAVPLMDEGDLWGVLNIESPKLNAFTQDDLVSLNRIAQQGMRTIHELAIRSRRGRQIAPLHFLSVIASRIQDPRHDRDTVLRLLLTGVTADVGLKFSRAMLFLVDEEGDRVNGVMAVGVRTREEAEHIWGRWDHLKDKAKESGRDIQKVYLDKVERFSEKLKKAEIEDYPLSQAIKGIPAISVEETGALTQCINEGRRISIPDNQSDPFRDLLKKNNVFPNNDNAFACIPLIARETILGAIVVDYQFTDDNWKIDDIVLGGLEIYARVMAMAIENANLRGSMDKEREAAWRYFARETIHSMGNRMAQIEGTIARLRSTCKHPTDESKPYLERLEAGIEESKALLIRFRDMLRPAELEREEIDLSELLASVENQSRDTLRMGGVEFFIQMSEQPITLMGDRHRLSDAFAELLRNARKAMEWESIENPGITIRASREGVNKFQVRIEVSNPGQGISRELKQRIFEPFYHGDGKGESQGLGLATIKKDIEAHQGTIEETGVPGEGACFTICLPCIK